ncbi:helix-turn-helix transcriptional regulator [Rothia halotolerans]|uniref:helix-turn-helix transcriptional regulator n=1 Tax=Rothia halotolerans TaxID=405770 RepID=UPI001EDF7630|nr:helix-turn-helix transcriptional regulator [Rothia halotolerans]
MSEPSEPSPAGRPDRLRELLDAVLADSVGGLTDMADQAHASRYHFARQVSRGAGESPVALRRQVDLERAAWRLRSGRSVTETAWEAGYDSVEGFTRAYRRAYGYPPSETPGRRPGGTSDDGCPTGRPGGVAHWLPAPNGIHFHAPDSLWIVAEPAESTGGGGGEQVTALLAHHDVADLRFLLRSARGLDAREWSRVRVPGLVLLHWNGPEESLAALLGSTVAQLEVWLAAIEGREYPSSASQREGRSSSAQEHESRGWRCPSADELLQRMDLIGPRWLAMVADVEQRRAWGDRLVDALCDPPESFVLGSVLAHVLTYGAQRRGIARALLRQDGVLPAEEDGDPIMWLRGGAE